MMVKTIFLLLLVLGLWGTVISKAEEKGIQSRGNIIYEDKLEIYASDFQYLEEKIKSLKVK